MIVVEKELDRLWETIIKPAFIKCISSSDNENINSQAKFVLKQISWKIKGGDVVKDKIPVWGSAFAYNKEGGYHGDLRGELVRYLEYHEKYIHKENGDTWEVKLNKWHDNTFINIKKQKNGKGA